MNKILIIGNGGREHALAWKFSQSKTVSEVYVAPGNPGMADTAKIVDIDANDFKSLIEFVKENAITLTFVGPEAPLSKGIVDAFNKAGCTIFGPTQIAAQLESSKSFAKELMKKYNIPTADYHTVTTLSEALDVLSKNPAPIVIKADGLAAGKGVTVAMSDEEAIEAVHALYPTHEPRFTTVIEEYLDGEEFSLMAFVHGNTVIPMDLAQDHKRAFDHDLGPNTGGMGAYSPVPQISREMIEETMNNVMIPMANAMVSEGMPFTGILYGGLMATKSGIKTIEFNVRFGDPETEVVLMRMQNDLDSVVFDVLNDRDPILTFDPRFAIGVVLANKGYPAHYSAGCVINGLGNVHAKVFHMGTAKSNSKFVTKGGRVLFAATLGDTLAKAREEVYKEIEAIECNDLFYRTDIGDRYINIEEKL